MEDIVKAWVDRDPDPVTRAELNDLLADQQYETLAQRFSGRLAFGTAGLRGVVGGGPCRMNRLVVRETTAGLGNYLLKAEEHVHTRGVVVGYDGRLDSRQFAQDAACVLAGLGIQVYLTPDVAATPIAAYGVLAKGAAAGVVVTASHNPPEYNGYKVYWGNGTQIIAPHDSQIALAIDVAATEAIPWCGFEQAISTGIIALLDDGFYRDYREKILTSPLFGRKNQDKQQDVSIAYTAMHGVGARDAELLLAGAGFDQFHCVSSQKEPDGSFPTVNFPNPEEPGAMDAVLELARTRAATLACANDPDADRLAVAVRKVDTGDYEMLTGDMVGILLGNYLLEQSHAFTPIVCTTIVSSSMLEDIAHNYNARFYATLTGFKWLSNVALEHEDHEHKFLFAYEEALGYACGDQVMDKDGLSALLAFVQMTQALAWRGLTVLEQLERLYRRYGIFLTSQRSFALAPDAQGPGSTLREHPPRKIGGVTVVSTDDLSSGLRTHADGRSSELELPRSDVLIYRLANRSRVIVRPSGTEPKVKCYYEIVQSVGEKPYRQAMAAARAALQDLAVAHQDELPV